MEDLEVLTRNWSNTAKGVTGTLRVTLPATFGRQYISPLLPEFMSRHPRLRLHIDLSDQMRDLVSDGLDLAIRIGILEDSGLVVRKLAPSRLVLCAAPAYLKAHGKPREPGELAKYNCLCTSLLPWGDEWRLAGKRGEVRVAVEGALPWRDALDGIPARERALEVFSRLRVWDTDV